MLLAVIRAGFPPAIINMIRALYNMVQVFSAVSGALELLFQALGAELLLKRTSTGTIILEYYSTTSTSC